MENAAEALQMAFAVLVFVVALSISINAFGQARATSQAILDMHDREADTTYVNESSSGLRIVRAESIVPTIYRAYKENYKIVFIFHSGDNFIYKKNNTEIHCIDLEKDVIGSDEQKERFIMYLLYGVAPGQEGKFKVFQDAGIVLNSTPLYDRIKGEDFIESLGVYYQDELDTLSKGYDLDNVVPEVNRLKKKVVTYEERN